MDFAMLPPEVNSGRMYAGPGSGPMLAAATAWARLAAETGSAATAYQSVLTGLDEGWLGPASESMAAAVAPYVAWLSTTAALAEQAAARAVAVAAAFDEAYAAVAPPPMIAANRSTLATLVATNVLGQNAAAIAAAEAEYAQLWVQDAVAMYGYAARSAAASALTPFTEPPATTNPSGAAGQAAAVAQATAGSGHAELSRLLGAIPQVLAGLGPAAASLPSAAAPTAPLTLTQLVSYLLILPKSIVPFNDAIKTVLYGMIQYARNLNTDLDIAAATGGRAGFGSGASALVAAEEPAALAARPMSAGVGTAGTIGRLSVPPNWTATAPVAKMAAAALPGAAAAAAAGAQIPTGVFGDLALAGLAGRALTGAAPRSRPAAAMNGHAQTRLERLVTELAGTTEVQHWHVDPSRLDSLLEELAEQPGVHAVHVNPDGGKPAGPTPQPG